MASGGSAFAMKPKNELNSFLADVGNRLREAEAHFKNRARAAETAGVSKSTFQRWENGESDPSFSGLAKIAAETGVSLDWLATGKGDMYGVKPPQNALVQENNGTPISILDENLLAEIATGIDAVYRDSGAIIPATHLGRTMARILKQLADVYSDPADCRVATKILLQQLRAEVESDKSDNR